MSVVVDPSDDPLGLRAWGIDPGYQDVHGRWVTTSEETATALRRSLVSADHDPDGPPPRGTPLAVVPRPPDEVVAWPLPLGDEVGVLVDPGTVLELEDGTTAPLVDGALPPDVPFGYHRLAGYGGDTVANVIVSPGRCHLPLDPRAWGVVVQLYAARSRRSWGIGDLADLRTITAWARHRGAGVVGLNPLHAPTPSPRPAPSPYSPSSRRWRDPIYLAVEEVAGAERHADLGRLAAEARALNDGERIDRAVVWSLKRDALERIWSDFRGDPAFGRFRAEHGEDLEAWAAFCAIADRHGPGWRGWPSELRRPGPAVARFAAEHADSVAFWAWLQWLVDEQLAAAGAPEVAIADLAVGIDPDGADAWQWQDLVADGVTVGAPPDLLGPDGQDWGLPPFVPWRLRDAAYGPLAATLRAAFRGAHGLRIDHVMGLFRLYWIPAGLGAARGAYVRFPGHELLDVVALESHRARNLVVGEDLGTVEPGVRELLHAAGVLSTRLLWFEEEPPWHWPVQAMAAITTHDLPTTRGVWTGVDLSDQQHAGVTIPEAGDSDMRHRLRVAASVDDDAAADEVVVGVHRHVAKAPSMIVTATLDDLLGAEHRPNIPGTIDEHPNWRIPLPRPIEDLDGDPIAETIADSLRHR